MEWLLKIHGVVDYWQHLSIEKDKETESWS
jgi:hypothetical protein